MPVAKLGIMLSRNFARRLVNVLGESRTKELLFTGRLLNGEEARVYGLVSLVEDSGLIYERTLETCRAIASHYPNAVRQAKIAVDSVTIAPDEDQAPYYVDAHDFSEAVRRFAPSRTQGER
ncbi:3-hydroxybutyryl-CoA dehydratase (crotonase) [mine drainage metagenome]|uniref:3-hydroxybutyryl-CoA dehydratase (Crotonase) n=1 Tax=mine drainage metagenome TaxID=410659 RepID=T1BNC4_9ZZZZ